MDLRHTVTRALYRRYRASARYFLTRRSTPGPGPFFRLLRVADRLTSQRRSSPARVEANRVWKASYLARYGATPPYRLRSDAHVARASADHQWPRGSLLNSNVNRRFNLKLYEYFRG